MIFPQHNLRTKIDEEKYFICYFSYIQLNHICLQNMVYKIKPSEPPLLYEENSRCERKRRYCLKPIKLIESKAAKDDASVNILFNRLVTLPYL